MKKYQKKPAIVEAIQLTTRNIFEVYSLIHGEPDLSTRIASDKWEDYEKIVIRDGMTFKTPESGEGTQIASIGDYIVKGNSPELGDHFWPVKPDYFENAYEEVIRSSHLPVEYSGQSETTQRPSPQPQDLSALSGQSEVPGA